MKEKRSLRLKKNLYLEARKKRKERKKKRVKKRKKMKFPTKLQTFPTDNMNKEMFSFLLVEKKMESWFQSLTGK